MKRFNLVKARKAKNMTQKQLGSLVGLTNTAISMLESGKTKGRVETWDKLELVLETNQRVLRLYCKEKS
jgi:transcriptional regulator with XRE-family HTH domain